jgi:hypothetical protein
MGRICAPQSLLHGWTASLQLCNVLSEIGDDFCLLLIVATSLSIILFFRMDLFAKLSSNAATFSTWTISYAVALLAKAELLEVMWLMLRISANAAVQ